jgi:hypothetical protein
MPVAGSGPDSAELGVVMFLRQGLPMVDPLL